MKSSRRDLLNDMAERKSILKNNQNSLVPPFWFHTQNRSGSTSQNGVFVLTVNVAKHRLPGLLNTTQRCKGAALSKILVL